ncbi:hypothetical protein HB976_14590 [Yersinia mollaretii]|uniref:hypothetical protein n=1 Tax=Yersinia mollaretii TaxID=33060 RepID=UPI001427C340|nr:hypothetical protein [Yersinia mollaretii]MDA5536452.1 hypothetical protein [Yersinia mollaretii]NIL04174.1 hypothetical protein [Yersinia mollaretii]
MSTHINTINAIEGLTCVANSLTPAIDLKPNSTARLMGDHARKHLTDAGIEIERLNNEITHLRNYASRLNENFSVIHSDRSLLMAAVRKTRAGAQAITGINYQSVADAVAAIEVTEDERQKALLTAESFQRAKFKAEPVMDVNIGWFNYSPFMSLAVLRGARRPGKTTCAQYTSISAEIIDEVIRASSIHPTWPTDAVHAVSILTEESGELMKAAIEYHYNNGDIEAVREEAVQTGAMALRVLMNIDKYKRPSDEK